MRARILALSTVAAVFLIGCSFPSAPRISLAPNDAIPASATRPISVNGKTVGVLFAADTVTDMDYLWRYHQHAMCSLEGRLLTTEIRQGYADSSRPERILSALKDALSSHLKRVTYYPDRPSLDIGNPDIIALVHTYHALLTPRTSDVRADYIADFFSRDGQYLGRAAGHRAISMPGLWRRAQRTEQVVNQLARQQAVQRQALDEFSNSLSRLIH